MSTRAKIDHRRAAAAVRELLIAVGEDPEREGLRDTPDRVARAYAEMFAGLQQDPAEVLKRVETRRMDPSAQYAMIASREAWADAGAPEVEPERLGVAIGTGISSGVSSVAYPNISLRGTKALTIWALPRASMP